MTPRDFAYWLQGFFEINEVDGGTKALTEKQTEMIRKHLDLVFKLDESIKPLRADLPTYPNQSPLRSPQLDYDFYVRRGMTAPAGPLGTVTTIC